MGRTTQISTILLESLYARLERARASEPFDLPGSNCHRRWTRTLRQRWPNYEADVGASLFSFERLVLDWRVRRVFAGASEAKRMRVLRIGDVALPDRYDVRDAATCDVDLKNEADVWSWLQSNAIDAVVANSETPTSLSHLAAALGIPFARVAGRDDVLRAVNESLQAARSFKDDNR